MNFPFRNKNTLPLYRDASDPEQPTPITSPGHGVMSLEGRKETQITTGHTSRLSWGACSDVGLLRDHNEDSYLIRSPLFAVCDGMGGHAAGEVASSIAVQTLMETAPATADDVLLGAAVESANAAVIAAAAEGKGKLGMGSTCTCAIIEGNHIAIAHVGDSRLYLLHAGTLVRLTHDHSYVEELVDAGEITADEARVHPSRSVITRALGSDPAMYADHFTLNISTGDRLILCSDGLSSMVEDSEIEAIAVSTVTPQSAANNLTTEALAAGGHDNVTVVVIDVLDDGLKDLRRSERRRRTFFVGVVTLAIIAIFAGFFALFIHLSWFIGIYNGNIAIYRGRNWAPFFNWSFYQVVDAETYSNVSISDLEKYSIVSKDQLEDGIVQDSEKQARETIESWRKSVSASMTKAQSTKDSVENSGITSDTTVTPSPTTPPDNGAVTGSDATGSAVIDIGTTANTEADTEAKSTP